MKVMVVEGSEGVGVVSWEPDKELMSPAATFSLSTCKGWCRSMLETLVPVLSAALMESSLLRARVRSTASDAEAPAT